LHARIKTGEFSARLFSSKAGISYSFMDLYSTSSRKLLRGANDSSTVKNNSFQLIKAWSFHGKKFRGEKHQQCGFTVDMQLS